jgi:chromosome segregation ATPase
MMLPCPCPTCGVDVPVPPHYLSRVVRCNSCANEFVARIKEQQQPAGAGSPESEAQAVPEVRKPKHRLGMAAIIGLAAFGAIVMVAAYTLERTHRSLLEQQVNMIEMQVHSTARRLGRAENSQNQLLSQGEDLMKLDETLTDVSMEGKQLGSSMLRTDYAVQQTYKSLIRQQANLGKLTERISLLERELADKDRNAMEALELATKQRKEAEEACKPIRARIKELEDQKEKLFVRYKNVSTPVRPLNVLSSRKATEMMNDWGRRTKPLLDQLEKEIETVRLAIESEEDKIDDLYGVN